MERDDVWVNDDAQPLEREKLLATLNVLIARTDNPVARECLREACDDIAHLTSTTDDEPLDPDVVAADESDGIVADVIVDLGH